MSHLFLGTRYTDDSIKFFNSAVEAKMPTSRLSFQQTDQVMGSLAVGEDTYVYMGWLWTERLKELGVKFEEPDDKLLLTLPEEYTQRNIELTTLQGEYTESFIKPLNGKSFDGLVINEEQWEDLKYIHGPIDILRASIVDFVSEYRFFIVEGVIVTMTHYLKEADRMSCALRLAERVVPRIEGFNYVLDVGITREGIPLVVEANPIHQSSIYNANAGRILPGLKVSN